MSKPGVGEKDDGDDGGDFTPIDAEEFTAEEKAAIERMERATPMPTSHEGGDPPEGETGEEDGDKASDARPKKAAAKAKAGGEEESKERKAGKAKSDAPDGEDVELEEGEEEITIDGEGRARDKNGQFVSKSALLRVKEESKTLRDQLTAQQQENAKILGRLQLLTEVINTPPDTKKGDEKKAAPENPWDEDDIDPVEDVVAAIQQQRRRERYNYDQGNKDRAGSAERDQQSAVVNTYMADSRRLVADQIRKGEVVEVGGQRLPAYQAAYLHLVNVRHAQLEAMGIADKAARDKRIAQEELELVQEAVAAKRSPAETIFALAKASGFTKPPPSEPQKKDGEDEDGKTEKQRAAEKKLEQVNKGKANAQSLSGKGGQAYGGMTVQQIIAMDDDAFAALAEKIGEDALNKMLGA